MLGSANADLSAMYRTANLGSLPTVTLNVEGRDDLVSCEISANDGKNKISDVTYEAISEKGESLNFSGNSFKLPEGNIPLLQNQRAMLYFIISRLK